MYHNNIYKYVLYMYMYVCMYVYSMYVCMYVYRGIVYLTITTLISIYFKFFEYHSPKYVDSIY